MKKSLIFTIFLAFTSITWAMDQNLSETPGAQDVAQAAALMPAQSPAEAAQSPTQLAEHQIPPFEQFPAEITQHILLQTIQAPTLNQAIKNFYQSTAVNRQTLAFRHNPTFNRILIKTLKKHFPRESLEDIVIKMDTPEALNWYIEQNPGVHLERLLHKAAKNNSPKIIGELILRKNVPVDAVTEIGSPLVHAAIERSVQAVQKLLELGANPNHRIYELTLLHIIDDIFHRDASTEKKLAIIRLLLKYGADVNAVSVHGATPLFHASNKDVVHELIINGADVNAQDARGNTPLMVHVGDSVPDTALRLLQEPTLNLALKNQNGLNALMAAVQGYAPIESIKFYVTTLIARGIDVNDYDSDGQTALDIAIERGDAEIIQILKDVGAKTAVELAAAAACPR